MTKKIKWVPNESGRISYDIIKVIFEGDILLKTKLKTKRPGEYILAIFPKKIGSGGSEFGCSSSHGLKLPTTITLDVASYGTPVTWTGVLFPVAVKPCPIVRQIPAILGKSTPVRRTFS